MALAGTGAGAGGAGLRRLTDTLHPHPHRGDLIAAGVVPLATAIALVNVRMDGEWGNGALFAITLLGCALILGMGLLAQLEQGTPRAYQSVLLVAGLILLAITLLRLAQLLGADDSIGSGSLTWTSLLVAGAAAYAAASRNSVVCTLIAALAAGVALLAFVDWAFDPESIRTFRWILLVLIGLYVVVHLRLRDWAPRHAVQVVVAAGVATVALALTLTSLIEFFGPGEAAATGWELVLLVAALGLIAYAAIDGERGPAYLGFLALLLFALIAGQADDDATILGWPLLLLVLGGAAVAAGLRPGRPQAQEPVGGSAAPPSAPAPAAPAPAPPPEPPAAPAAPATEHPTEPAAPASEEPTEAMPPPPPDQPGERP